MVSLNEMKRAIYLKNHRNKVEVFVKITVFIVRKYLKIYKKLYFYKEETKMSEKIENLSELKDKVKLEEPANEQLAPEKHVPEQGKKTLKEKFADAKKASVTKKIEKEQKKIEKLQQKLNPVEKEKKIHIDKKKVLIGAGIGAAVLGSIGAACLRHAGQIEELPCDDAETPDCCEQPTEDPVPENAEEEA